MPRILLCCLLMVLGAACGPSGTEPPSGAPGAAPPPAEGTREERAAADTTPGAPPAGAQGAVEPAEADTAALLLIERLPLGLGYEEVRSRLPGIGPLVPEGAGSLTQASLARPVLGHEATLELNFEADRLYSYYYHLDPLPCSAADTLYERLQRFYGRHFGAHREEREEEGAYRAASSFWTADGFAVTLTRGRQGEACRLAWGFQEARP